MHFPFLSLPREVRDQIYEQLFWIGQIRIDHRLTSNDDDDYCLHVKEDDNYTNILVADLPFSLFFANRQLPDEARSVFYGINTFFFQSHRDLTSYDHNLLRATREFLRILKPVSFTKLRRLALKIQDYTQEISYHKRPSKEHWQEVCDLLSSIPGGLQHLELRIYNDDYDPDPYVRSNIMNLGSEGPPPEPWLLQDLLNIRNLGSLQVHWEYREEQLHYIKRTVTAARLMQRSMLKDGQDIAKNTGLRLRLRHSDTDKYGHNDPRQSTRYIVFEVSVDSRGSSKLKHQRRVKVRPDVWCRYCGRFQIVQTCGCNISWYGRDWYCYGCDEYCAAGDWQIVLCQCFAPSIQRHFAPPGSIVRHHLSSPSIGSVEREFGSDESVWDSKKWGGGPLEAYHPQGVTGEDFEHAKQMLEAGNRLLVNLPRNGGERDWDDDDYGDADSLCSVHGWSDYEAE